MTTTTISYFEARNVERSDPRSARLPPWSFRFLPKSQAARILDIGCGQGGLMFALKHAGYNQVEGLEQDAEAVAHCRANGLTVHEGDILATDLATLGTFDLVTMTHVLEHLPKADMIKTLEAIRLLLAPGGALYVAVPNAQSNTDAYWAFEDFTHTFLFTSGSLYYAGRMAGFTRIDFLDMDCTDGNSVPVRWARKILLKIYRAQKSFWNAVTRSSYHNQSAQIFSYEIKALLRP